jgi:hypothetical protein
MVPSSNNIVSHQINDTLNDIETTSIQLKNSSRYTTQLDESTDTADSAVLLVVALLIFFFFNINL